MYRRRSQCCPGFYESGNLCIRELSLFVCLFVCFNRGKQNESFGHNLGPTNHRRGCFSVICSVIFFFFHLMSQLAALLNGADTDVGCYLVSQTSQLSVSAAPTVKVGSIGSVKFRLTEQNVPPPPQMCHKRSVGSLSDHTQA